MTIVNGWTLFAHPLFLEQVQRLMAASRGQVFLAGLLGAFMLTVPVVNLLAPLLVAAAMVHVWKQAAQPRS